VACSFAERYSEVLSQNTQNDSAEIKVDFHRRSRVHALVLQQESSGENERETAHSAKSTRIP
jgi:hypothetical protein